MRRTPTNEDDHEGHGVAGDLGQRLLEEGRGKEQVQAHGGQDVAEAQVGQEHHSEMDRVHPEGQTHRGQERREQDHGRELVEQRADHHEQQVHGEQEHPGRVDMQLDPREHPLRNLGVHPAM